MSHQFWKEIHGEALRQRRESGFLEWKRLSTSVGLPIGSGLIQWWAGVSLPVNIAVNLGGGLLLYTLLVFIERYVQIRKVIEQCDAQKTAAILERDARIAELSKPLTSPFRAKILELNMDISNYDATDRLGFLFLAEFRNISGPDTSFHSVQLCFIDDTEVVESQPSSISRPLARGDMWKERYTAIFNQMGRERAMRALAEGSQWKVYFMDIHDIRYESEIFTRTA